MSAGVSGASAGASVPLQETPTWPRTDARPAAMIRHNVFPIQSAVRSTKMGWSLMMIGRK